MKKLFSLNVSTLSPISVRVGRKSVYLLQARFHQGAIAALNSESVTIEESDSDRDRAVAKSIAYCLSKGEFKGRKAVLILSNEEVLIEHQRVPVGPDEGAGSDIEARLLEELRLSNTCDMDNSFTRYLPLGEVYERHERKEELLLMVVGTEVIDRYIKVFKSAHLTLHRIAVEPFALQSAALRFCPVEWMGENPTGMINIGETKIDILILHKGQVAFVRSLPLGVEKFTASIARRMSIDEEGMARIVHAMGNGGSVNETVEKAVKAAVRPDMELVASEIITCFRYFSANHNREPVDRLIVVGSGAAQLAGKNFLRDRLDVPVLFWRDDLPVAGDGNPLSGNRLDDEYVSLAGLAADEFAGVKQDVDFLPEEVETRRLRKKVNRLRTVYLLLTLCLIAMFYSKASQRLTRLNSLNDMFVSRSNLLQMNTKAVDQLKTLSSNFVDRESQLSMTVCPVLPSRVLAEIVCVAGPGISLGMMSADFSYDTRHEAYGKKGKKTRQVTDHANPRLFLTVVGKAASADEVSLFVERLKKTGAFSSIRDEGSWDVLRNNSDQKQFTIKLTVGEG